MRLGPSTALAMLMAAALVPSCGGKGTGAAAPSGSGAVLPPAPTGLAAAAESGGAVRLSWTAPSKGAEITGYQLYRDGVLVKFVSPSLTTYLDTTVQPEGAYQYQLESVAASGSSAKTAAVSATTPSAPPLTDARVEGRFLIDGKVTKTTFTNYHMGDPYTTTWYFTPVCDTGPCNVKTGGDGDTEAVLKRRGLRYSGKVTVPHGAQCGSARFAETETIDFRVTAAQFHQGVWLATKIQGTFRIDTGAALGCDSGYSELTFKGA